MIDHNDDSAEFEQFIPLDSPQSRSAAKTLKISELRQRITHRAVSYLSRREYSQTELKRKLQLAFIEYEWPVNDEFTSLDQLIDVVLQYLAHNNWQSDQRFATQVSKVKGERYGTARVKQTLNQQGLAKELIDATVADLAQTELQRAHAVWQKKFGEPPSNAKEYAKQTRFMAYRGFSFDIIKQVIRGDADLMDESL